MTVRRINNFDALAPYYDTLARIVYGKSIQRAQTEFIYTIPVRATILILGGGTGWILDSLTHGNQGHKIYFIEASSEMIGRAQRRSIDGDVIFIHGTEAAIPQGLKFDVVMTNFYFDLFTNAGVQHRIQHIAKFCNDDARWLVTDFVNTRWWHSLLLKSMYAFFKLTSGIEADHLPDWEPALHAAGYSCTDQRGFYKGFIQSYVFEKNLR